MNNNLTSAVMMSRVALFLMCFAPALFLSFVKGKSPNGGIDVQGDGGSGGTQQQHDQRKKAEAMARLTVTADNQTDLDPDGACDVFRPLMKHLQDQAAFILVRTFLLENLNLYIIGLRE